MQLLRIDWNVLFTIINLIVLYLLLKKFLIGPVTGIMQKRKEMIEGQLADADDKKKQAGELKQQYAISSSRLFSFPSCFTFFPLYSR